MATRRLWTGYPNPQEAADLVKGPDICDVKRVAGQHELLRRLERPHVTCEVNARPLGSPSCHGRASWRLYGRHG